MKSSREIIGIFIGTSAGGVQALQKIFSLLENNFTIPIAIVQHMPPSMNINLKLVFGSFTKLNLVEVSDKLPMQPGSIYFSPASYHTYLEKDCSFSLSLDEPVHFARPSIDVFFESVADSYGSNACAILLTGANADGAKGIYEVQKSGGLTIVQDPKTAEVTMMPLSALAIMQPDHLASLEEIASLLNQLSLRNKF
jgi:two-component system, chemotaxis family, protein-glutamate methylesterase/glutaminase